MLDHRCDLSMLAENQHAVNGTTMLAITSLVKNVLVNHTRTAWDCLKPRIVDGKPTAAGIE